MSIAIQFTKTLKQPSATRWTSAVQMLESLLANQQVINDMKEVNLTDGEWRKLQFMCDFLNHCSCHKNSGSRQGANIKFGSANYKQIGAKI